MKNLAARTADLTQSDIRAVSRMVQAVDGINLGQGICDLPTPPMIRGAARAAIERNWSTYSSFAGIPALRSFVAEKLRDFNRIPVDSDDEVIVTVGSTGAFAMALMAILDPGDEVILFEPFYGYHTNLLKATGGVPVTVLQRGEEWSIDFEQVEAAVTSRTKAFVITTPGNPHGKVWTRQELTGILDIAERHDLWIITDEIYEYMTYDNHQHVSMASLRGAYDRTITISGFSKTYNMTGCRLGYAAGRPPLIDKMGLLNDLFYICAPTPLQHGVAAARELSDDFYAALRRDYALKRELMCATLEEVGFDVPWPQGAYYVLASFRRLAADHDGFEDDRSACRTLIDRCGIGTVAGSAFFAGPAEGRFRLRFCFAKELDELNEACDRLKSGLLG